jgi:RNA polymerase sigma-70 factor (ECF subfamily)
MRDSTAALARRHGAPPFLLPTAPDLVNDPERPDPQEDELLQLTAAAAAGDRDAVERLLERMLPDLRAFVRLRASPMLRRHDAQSDLVQSVCREILTHTDRFEHASEGAFRRWLFTTTLRKLSNRRNHHLAVRRDVGREVSGADREAALMDAYARIATPSRHASVREELARVEAAMETLDEEERAVIVLARIVGLSRAQIADELGITEGAVRMRLHRALATLSVRLGES